MEWIVTIVTGVVVFVLALPLLGFLLTVFVLMPLAHLYPGATSLARARFNCPFSRRPVNATFATEPGADRPSDVTACSVFGTGEVRCEKDCLASAHSAWEPSPMTPRYALIADGIATRREV